MSNYSKIAEEEFQKLPLEEKEKLVSVVQTWNKAFECGVFFGMKNVKIKELKEQIEKMKCCGNCNKLRGRFDSKTNINILYCSDSDMRQIEVGFQMCCCKWEIKEK